MQLNLFAPDVDPAMRAECLRQFRSSMSCVAKYDAQHARHKGGWNEGCTRCNIHNAITQQSMLRDYRKAFAELNITEREALS